MSVLINADTSDGLKFTSDTSGEIKLQSAGTDIATVNSSGIDVTGDFTIADKIIHSGDTNTAIRFPSADTVTVETAGTERMRIDSSGNVLVGTTSPATGFTARLNSATTGTSWAAQFENNNTTYDSILCVNHATSGNNRFIGFGTEATWTERGYIYYDRAAGQTKLSATSDYRAKDIVGDTVGALDLVSSIKVKDAKLKWAEGQAYPMYIAHELQEVAPWAVSGEKDAVDDEGKPVYQTVSYESMVATLTAAIQEMKSIIDEQSARITALENK